MEHIARIENEIILHGRKNNQAWFEPRIDVMPTREANSAPEIFVVATLLTGTDIGPQLFIRTADLGKTWTPPVLSQQWHKIPMADDVFEEPWFGPLYHNKTGKLVAIGGTHCVADAGSDVVYQCKKEQHVRVPGFYSSIAYSAWNPRTQDFEPWKRLKTPDDSRLGIYYAGQKHECDDGSVLMPGYYYSGPARIGNGAYSNITVLRCKYDGLNLEYLEHGSIHAVQEARGLAEPSLVYFRKRYLMTIRHDFRGYVTTSEDGLNFKELATWKFDDGLDLGNYNTQQHWLKHKDRLYLVYNRRSELNHGVVRSRAPLYMAEVDPDKLCIIRNTERIVFPEKGARMGCFCIADASPAESWVITGEWLQGTFDHSDNKKGKRFWTDCASFNYIQFIGDLLLARVYWND